MKRDLKEEEEAMQRTGGRAFWQMAETSLCKGSEAGKKDTAGFLWPILAVPE